MVACKNTLIKEISIYPYDYPSNPSNDNSNNPSSLY